jgi:hypothetical protein
MKTIFENIRLTVSTEKKALRVNKPIIGILKLSSGFIANFIEGPHPLGTILRKSIRLKHGNGFNVSFNPEKNYYRITIGIDANEPDWGKSVLRFTRCLSYVEGREEV